MITDTASGSINLAEAAAIPVQIVGGFLGAGKTTLLNRLITTQQDRRLAIIVNDFGAIDIDGLLVERREEDILALKNGCICCSLQSDLFSTLRMILSRNPPPDAIFIECSGVSRLDDMRQALADPVLWRHAALDGVICVVNAIDVASQTALTHDPLWREQIQSSDLIVLSHTDELDADAISHAKAGIKSLRGAVPVLTSADTLLTHAAFFSPVGSGEKTSRFRANSGASEEFSSLEWCCDTPLDLAAFQRVIEQYAVTLLRAKGILYLASAPHRPLLLQMTGTRVTIGSAPDKAAADPATRLVFIGRQGVFDPAALKTALDALPT